MRSAAIAAVLALIVVASFGAGYLVGNGAQRARIVTSTTSSTLTATLGATVSAIARCPGSTTVQFQQPPVNFSRMPVLLMKPNTTATVCVTYMAEWADNQGLFRYYPFNNGSYGFFPAEIDKLTCVVTYQTAGCAGHESHSFQISVNPAVIQPAASDVYVTITYTITALPNATGFYDRAFVQACEAPRLAVGFEAAQVNGSDFAAVPVHSCPSQPYLPYSMTVSGMNVAYATIRSIDWPTCLPKCATPTLG